MGLPDGGTDERGVAAVSMTALVEGERRRPDKSSASVEGRREIMNRLPNTCLSCRLRPCERAPDGALDLCQYGVVFRVAGTDIVRREATLPIKHLAANLRHELNPILSFVVNELSSLDPTLSTRRIETDKGLGRVLGATLVLDDTIQMITGVYDMHLLSGPQNLRSDPVEVEQIVRTKFAIYSLIGGANRAKRLDLRFDGCGGGLRYGVPLIEYVIAVLMDNAWKFSEDGASVSVAISRAGADLADMVVSNVSTPLNDDLDVFGLGVKGAVDSKGFGYGLHWAQLLVERYNEGLADGGPPLEIEHAQRVLEIGRAIQAFSLRSLRVDQTERPR